ncbi:MAG: hypothetical protein R2867_36575 [Caldilineaceae bacterium]
MIQQITSLAHVLGHRARRYWLLGVVLILVCLTALRVAPLAAQSAYSPNETLPPALTLHTAGSGSISADPPTSQTYDWGQIVTLTAQPTFGWWFTEWIGDLSGTLNPDAITMTGDRTVTAVFTKQPLSTIVSDDFNQCALASGRWSFVDPLADATLFVNGQSVEISVPAGISHDIWTAGNQAPRLMQPANDVDFVIESKFDSVISQRLQMQGLLVMQDDGNLVRVNVQYDGSNTRLLVATFQNGVPTLQANEIITSGVPIYLRLQRASDEWLVTYGYDGSNWLTADTLSFRHTMTVAEVGLFVGNAGSNPAHTGVIDYFFNTASPITPEDPIRNTVPVHVVGEGTVVRSCGSPITLTAQPALGWNFGGWSGSASGAINPLTFAISGTEVVTATFTPKPYTLDLHTVGGGHITSNPKQQYFDLGNQVMVTAVADQGWVFTGWSGDFSSPNLALPLTITGNISLSANFAVLNDNSGFLSDDFNQCQLGAQWNYIDPVGDGRLALTGTGLVLSVPQGSEHNIWTTGNFAPRVMQPISDSDFELEVKFESAVEKRFQLQGLLIEADANNFLRVNFQHDGTNVRLLAITFTNGNPNVRVDQVIPSGAPLFAHRALWEQLVTALRRC